MKLYVYADGICIWGSLKDIMRYLRQYPPETTLIEMIGRSLH